MTKLFINDDYEKIATKSHHTYSPDSLQFLVIQTFIYKIIIKY